MQSARRFRDGHMTPQSPSQGQTQRPSRLLAGIYHDIGMAAVALVPGTAGREPRQGRARGGQARQPLHLPDAETRRSGVSGYRAVPGDGAAWVTGASSGIGRGLALVLAGAASRLRHRAPRRGARRAGGRGGRPQGTHRRRARRRRRPRRRRCALRRDRAPGPGGAGGAQRRRRLARQGRTISAARRSSAPSPSTSRASPIASIPRSTRCAGAGAGRSRSSAR